ncbi:MAG: proton-conducting transporter membrane subunit [Candidatus Nitrotoga sp.]|nr:proton-conducting transporter membrane subunit [Candidatus Nitrotoga sp.]MDO9447782.1 proton-conducting transporter membrane subunit [Candidatus Nitrotoga sp.]MDP1636584.1 proton-conducting transporter membrane subunit [Candidatus Nitrotoga sp.]MDP1856652.1 proton-conducting transporter membrane subunit [Candidatus Nitrotoga sp.]MDP3497902.1 proton-conducting transporter membrane subunit [Candidatus Nitrotoga sp.]
MTDPIAWLILLPLTWATVAFLAGPGRGGRLAFAGLSIQLALTVILARGVADTGERIHHVGGWGAPLGIELAADGLSAVMLLLTQAVALPLILYARAYFADDPQGVRYFWPLTGYLLAAMNALFLSADIFNLYVTLEMVSFAAVGLVAAKGGTEPIAAALRYLLTSLLGSGAYLFGVAMLYGAYGSVSLSVLAPLIKNDAPEAVMLAAALMVTGLVLKTALFPFHFWLPPAHGGTPAPVSALLSALVIKASFYLIVRLWFTLFLPLSTPAVAQLLGGLGTCAILWGSVMALRQTRLKMLVAYSTVAQVGYLFLVFPIVTHTVSDATQSAFQGAVLQALAHGMAKAAMFAAAGSMILSAGRDDITLLGGISARLPLTLFTFALAGVTLMGLPPSVGFLAKWLLIDGAITSGQWGWIAVMITGSLFTAAYVFKVLRHAFLQSEEGAIFRPLPRMLEWPPFLLACASLVLGMQAGDVLNLLGTP